MRRVLGRHDQFAAQGRRRVRPVLPAHRRGQFRVGDHGRAAHAATIGLPHSYEKKAATPPSRTGPVTWQQSSMIGIWPAIAAMAATSTGMPKVCCTTTARVRFVMAAASFPGSRP